MGYNIIQYNSKINKIAVRKGRCERRWCIQIFFAILALPPERYKKIVHRVGNSPKLEVKKEIIVRHSIAQNYLYKSQSTKSWWSMRSYV